VVQTAKLGHKGWVPEITPVISKTPGGRGKPKSQGAHACGVDSASGSGTSKESWKALMPVGVMVSKGSSMHDT